VEISLSVKESAVSDNLLRDRPANSWFHSVGYFTTAINALYSYEKTFSIITLNRALQTMYLFPVYETNTFNLNMQWNVIIKSRNFDVHSPSKANYIGNPDYNSSLQLVLAINCANVTVFCFSVQNHQEANFSCQKLQCLFHSGIRLVNIAAYASKVV
jgi:hypothetical protein